MQISVREHYFQHTHTHTQLFSGETGSVLSTHGLSAVALKHVLVYCTWQRSEVSC